MSQVLKFTDEDIADLITAIVYARRASYLVPDRREWDNWAKILDTLWRSRDAAAAAACQKEPDRCGP